MFSFFKPTTRDEWLQYSSSNSMTNSYCNIVDRNGTLLLSEEKQEASDEDIKNKMPSHRYAREEATRRSTIQVVGDPSGNTKTSALYNYRKNNSLEFSVINGFYNKNSIIGSGKTKLTISADISNTIADTLEPHEKAVVLVSNYTTGEILACVSKPFYDPIKMPSDIDTNPIYNGAFLNKAFECTYAPGSVFKLVTLTALLERQKVNSISYQCTGQASFYSPDKSASTTVTCEDGVAHGALNLQKMLTQSCNCGFASMGVYLGDDYLEEFVEKSQVTSSFDIGASIKTAEGNFAAANNIELAWSSVGQGKDMVSPVAFLSFINAIANGGISKGFSMEQDNSGDDVSVIKASTAQTVSNMMRMNVENNYSKRYTFPKGVCAKSGTAQINSNTLPHSWFVGFINNRDTPYSFVILIENGGSGSKVAGKVASEILAYLTTNEI